MNLLAVNRSMWRTISKLVITIFIIVAFTTIFSIITDINIIDGLYNFQSVSPTIRQAMDTFDEFVVTSIFNAYNGILFLFIFAIVMTSRSMRFLSTLSVTRSQIYLSCIMNLSMIAFCLQLLYFILVNGALAIYMLYYVNTVNRATLSLLWFENPLISFERFVITFFMMQAACASLLLSASLIARWKKQILLIGIGSFVLLVTFLTIYFRLEYLEKNLNSLSILGFNVLKFLEDTYKFFFVQEAWVLCFRQFILAVVYYGLAYPVMRYTKVK